jgi:H+/Cl- antiporter ClcA
MSIGAAFGRLAARVAMAAAKSQGDGLGAVSLPAWAAVGAAGLLAGHTRLLLSVRADGAEWWRLVGCF